VTTATVEFWRLFRESEARLATAESADDPDYEALLERLRTIHPRLCLELCSEPGECELIVTAQGDPSLFSLVHAIVAEAPVVNGWSIRSLRPKLGFPTTVTWESLTIRIDEVVFAPLELDASERFALRIFVPGLKPSDADHARSAVLRALDHGLGEELLARAIGRTEVVPMPKEAERADFIPLVDLERFLEWRDDNRAANPNDVS
jgi:hypothetical protein